MEKKCLANAECPLTRAYNSIGDWWSILIMTRILLAGTRRFSEIQEALGMAKNILTSRLKKLVEEGLLEKAPAADGSAYLEYVPTPRGTDLFKVLVTLRQWGENHFFTDEDVQYYLTDKKSGKSVPQVEVRATDGRVLKAGDLQITVKKKNTKRG